MNRQELLLKISQAQFAAWELRLYLDTHASDMRATAMMREYEKKYNILVAQYEEKYGPLTSGDSDSADWLASPWPWENARCD